MKISSLVIVFCTIMIFSGTASANSSVEILPTFGDVNVTSDGTIIVPIGQDSFTTVGLSFNYSGFNPNESFAINITRDSDNFDVYNNSGNLGSSGNGTIEIHWVPIDNQSYTILASGYNNIGKRIFTRTATAPIMPIPELDTIVLLSAGLIGIFGLVRIKRKE